MKVKILLLLLFIVPATFIYGQNNVTYKITKTVTYDAGQLEQALQMCSLDHYRRADQRVVMHFKDGSTVELFSAQELSRRGTAVDLAVTNTDPIFDLESTFILAPQGYILEQVKEMPTLEEQKDYIISKQKNK